MGLLVYSLHEARFSYMPSSLYISILRERLVVSVRLLHVFHFGSMDLLLMFEIADSFQTCGGFSCICRMLACFSSMRELSFEFADSSVFDSGVFKTWLLLLWIYESLL